MNWIPVPMLFFSDMFVLFKNLLTILLSELRPNIH